MKFIHSSVLFLSIITSHLSNANPLDCGCLKDVVYGEREYSCTNSTGDGVSQSEVLSKLINAGAFIHNQCSKWFGDGSQLDYLKVISNDYANEFTMNDVLECVGSNIADLDQMKLALDNINQMRITSHGIPLFDIATTTLISAGVGKVISGASIIVKGWKEIGSFAVGLATSGYKGYQNVGDIFAYLAIEESTYCQKKFLKKFVVRGDVEKN
jgi:hypothetical protein